MNIKYRRELVNVLVQIKTPKLMDDFLEDILTPTEFDDLVTRWQIIKLLAKGVPQREIAQKLGVSIAKITRGSREMRDVKGGFNTILKMKKF